MKVILRSTGEIKLATYANTKNGDKKMNVDGKFYTDKQFSKLFFTPTEAIPTQTVLNIVNTLRGKKVLFLENDNELDNGLDEFQRILEANDIEHKILFDLSSMNLQEIAKEINNHDAIVFMTQWVYDIAKKLKDYMFSLTEKKIVIEAYINTPTWYYKPKTIHDVYIYSCMGKESENFYKLSNKPYWNYKNNFNN